MRDIIRGKPAPDGLHDYDRVSCQRVAIEVCAPSTRLHPSILEALPTPSS